MLLPGTLDIFPDHQTIRIMTIKLNKAKKKNIFCSKNRNIRCVRIFLIFSIFSNISNSGLGPFENVSLDLFSIHISSSTIFTNF